MNGSPERLEALHAIAEGDRILIGGYEVVARYPHNEAAEPVAQPQAAADTWGDWAPEPRPAVSWGASVAERRDAPRVSPPLPDGGGWDTPAPLSRPSAWSSHVWSSPSWFGLSDCVNEIRINLPKEGTVAIKQDALQARLSGDYAAITLAARAADVALDGHATAIDLRGAAMRAGHVPAARREDSGAAEVVVAEQAEGREDTLR